MVVEAKERVVTELEQLHFFQVLCQVNTVIWLLINSIMFWSVASTGQPPSYYVKDQLIKQTVHH